MKKEIQKMLVVLVVITIAGLIWSMTSKFGVTNLEIGKTYQKTYKMDCEDPFTVPIIDTFTVIDKKNGYVKWTKRDWIEGDTVKRWLSSPEEFLGLNVKLIK